MPLIVARCQSAGSSNLTSPSPASVLPSRAVPSVSPRMDDQAAPSHDSAVNSAALRFAAAFMLMATAAKGALPPTSSQAPSVAAPSESKYP